MDTTLQNIYEKLDELYTTGKQAEVERFLISSADEIRPISGEFNPHYVAVLNELASFYRGRSQYDSSKEVFSEARDMIYAFLGEHSVEYASVLINVAGTYIG